MGETWDEAGEILTGAKLVNLVSHLNFTDKFWYEFPDHPPVTRYIHGISAIFDQNGKLPDGSPAYDYNFTYSRITDAVFGSGTIALTYLLAAEFFDLTTAFFAGIIFSLLPLFVGFTQLVTLESVLTFFFTASVYSFLKALQKINYKRIIVAGIVLGLALGSKYTNALLIPILGLILFAWYKLSATLEEKKKWKKLLLILPISLLTLAIIWPPLIFEPVTLIKNIYNMREPLQGSTQELFMGKSNSTSYLYFIVYLFITTPLLILGLFFTGIATANKKKFIFWALVIWFFVPFIQSFYFRRENGMRYLIEIYAPLSILASLGLSFLVKKFKQHGAQLLYFAIPIYLVITLFTIAPYYLSYYNSLVGGTLGVYQNRSFPLEWWGEGQSEAANYLVQTVHQPSTVGLYVIPSKLIPPVGGLTYVNFDPKKPADYLIVNYFALITEGYTYDQLPKNYSLVYTVEAGGAPIVEVFKRIQ